MLLFLRPGKTRARLWWSRHVISFTQFHFYSANRHPKHPLHNLHKIISTSLRRGKSVQHVKSIKSRWKGKEIRIRHQVEEQGMNAKRRRARVSKTQTWPRRVTRDYTSRLSGRTPAAVPHHLALAWSRHSDSELRITIAGSSMPYESTLCLMPRG